VREWIAHTHIMACQKPWGNNSVPSVVILRLAVPDAEILDAVQSPTFYIEAFFDGNLEWTEYAYSERELQELKDQALFSGCTFTVRLEDDEN